MNIQKKPQLTAVRFSLVLLFLITIFLAADRAMAEVPKLMWQSYYSWKLKAIAAGPSGEVAAFGDYHGFVDIRKYGSTGAQAWDRMAAAAGIEAMDDVYIDAEGNTIAIARHGTYGHGALFLKYDRDGNQVWSKSAEMSPYSYAIRAARDRQGNFYLGQSYKVSPEYWRPTLYAIVKYDSEINQLAVFNLHMYDVAVSGDGEMYVSSGNQIVKYDADGNQLWAAQTGTSAKKLAADRNGNVYALIDGTIRKYDSEGTELWSAATTARSVAIGPKGNLYTAGPDGVVKYHIEGGIEWTIADRASLIAVGPGGDVYTALSTYQYDAINAIRRYSVNSDPAADAGHDRTIEITSCNGASVTLDASGSTDSDGDPLTYSWSWTGGSAAGVNPTVSLPFGETTVTLTVSDGNGGTATDTVDVTVVDTAPPVLTVAVTPGILWPPNHEYARIAPSIRALDACAGAVRVELLSAVSNEPDNGTGNGDRANDIIINADGAASVRAERSGAGTGRIYTFTYKATDGAGNTSVASAFVTVPHDMRK